MMIRCCLSKARDSLNTAAYLVPLVLLVKLLINRHELQAMEYKSAV